MKNLLETEFANIAENIPNLFFIEVGANDGVTVDPLHNLIAKHKWNGILIEPNPVAIKDLKNNYISNTNLIFEECIISENDGVIDFYYNGDNITTLHNTLCERYADVNFGIDKKTVPTLSLTFDSLLKKHNVNKVDLLMIDVEGYDAVLLKSFPYHIMKPKLVRAEHIHVSYNNNTVEEMELFLTEQGYECFLDENRTDIIGILK